VTRGYREAAAAFLAPAQASRRSDPAVVRWMRERVDGAEIGAPPVPPACGRREVNNFFLFSEGGGTSRDRTVVVAIMRAARAWAWVRCRETKGV